MTRIAIPTAVLLAAFALRVTAVETEPEPKPEPEPENVVPKAPVEIRGAIIALVEQVQIPAREVGVLREVNVRPGQRVSEGEILAQLDDVDARLSADQTDIELKSARELAANDIQIRAARKSHEVSLAELKRSLDAVEKISTAISNTELDRLRLTAESAELAIEQAQVLQRTAQLDADLKASIHNQAQRKIERHQIRSSLDGVVVQVAKHRGEWVEPGATVFHILRLDTLRCEGRLPISQVRPGMEGRAVRIRVKVGDDQPMEVIGRITNVEPRVNPIKEDVVVWAEFANEGLVILPGMKAEMEVLAAEEVAASESSVVE